MKEIRDYQAQKYKDETKYRKIEEGIYEYKEEEDILYVTSLSFEQEEEYGEGEFADDISQYPLEDVLDEFYCHITDFYEDINLAESKTCYLEFAATEEGDIRSLRKIIGKHVYNKTVDEGIILVIE
ncbi:MAG: hypothetical protein Q3993_03365 [Filifactor alocis]|nr:hypothetical protein [Filifactor alocis]